MTDGSSQSIPDEGSLAAYPSLNNLAQPNMAYSIDGVRVPLDHFMVIFNLNFKSNLQLAGALAKSSANDANFQKRRIGPPGDSREESTAVSLSSSLSWLIGFEAQEPAKPSHDRNAKNVPPAQPNDCLIFASMADKLKWELYYALASPWSGGEGAFMDKLATMFTEFRSASLVSLAAQRGGYSNEGFGHYHDRGFKPEFRDPDPASDNQVRHAVGGLIAGYVLGNKPSDRRIMDAREDMNTESGRADTRLNRVTMPMGNLLRNHVGFYELGDWIRKNLCAK